jgi:hypothetical protein
VKEGCLFVLFMDPLNQDALDRVLGVFGKLLMIKKGCMGLVPRRLDFQCRSS